MFLTKHMGNATCCVRVFFFFILFVCQLFSFDRYTVVCICLKILGVLYPPGFPRALYFILVFQGHARKEIVIMWCAKISSS